MSRKRPRGAIGGLILFLIIIIGISVYSSALELSEYSPKRILYLRYKFEPIELDRVPVDFQIQETIGLLDKVSRELDLTKYNYEYVLSVPISPKSGGYEFAEVCLFASSDAYLEVEILYANTYYEYTTKLTLIGGIVGYCSSSNKSTTVLESILAGILVHSNITLNDLRIIRANITYLSTSLAVLGFHYNDSIAFTVRGRIDPSTWSAITPEGGYYNDWYFTLPSTSGGYAVILYSKLYSEAKVNTATSGWDCGSRSFKGYSILYLVNSSSIYNKRYEIEGLGVIEPADTVYGSCVGGFIVDLVMPSNTSVEQILGALKGADYLKFYVYKVYNESNMIRLVPKQLFYALQAYRSRTWAFDFEACSITKDNSELYRVPIIFPRIKYTLPVVRVSNEYYTMSGCNLWGALLVYSRSYGVLLEAVPLSELGSGVLPAYLRYTLSPHGAEVVLWSVSNLNTLGLKLVEVRGLAERPFVSVRVTYARDYLSITGKLLAITYMVFLPILLLGSRRYLLGLLLLALGLSMVSASFVKLLPKSLDLSIITHLDNERAIYMYSSKESIVSAEVGVGNESCLINVTAKLRAVSGDLVSQVNAKTRDRLLVGVNLSDPAVYELSIVINSSSVECAGERAQIDLRLMSSKAYYRLRSQLVYGLALMLLGLTASMVAYLGRAGSALHRGMGGFLGNLSWHLRSNLLDIVSALLLPAYYLLYAMSPASCKLGGLCLGRSVEQLALKASVMPSAVYLLASLYAVVAAALLFGYHIDSGIDRRLVLLGISRLRLLASKLLALVLLVSIPLAAARVGVYILVEPSASSPYTLAVAALAYGVFLALLFGGLSALASVLAGRPSYALLALIPAVVAILNTTPVGRPLTYESLAFKLLGVVEPGVSLYGLVYLGLAGIIVNNLMLVLAYLRREL